MIMKAFPFNGNTIISSDEMIYPKSFPQSMTIIGGGVIGCEFACLLSEFGSKVTIVEMLPHLLPMEDIDTSKTMEREMKKRGAELFLGRKWPRSATALVGRRCSLESGKTVTSRKGAGIGRPIVQYRGHQYRSRRLRIKQKTVQLKLTTRWKQPCRVSMLSATVQAGKYLLAYTASYEGTVAVANALGRVTKTDYVGVPNAIFTDPEVGSVGLTQQKAEELGV